MIVLEGIDGSGKSTLACKIAFETGLPIQQGDGPPKDRSHALDRIDRYLNMDGFICDRHPVVSEEMYGLFTHNSVWCTKKQRQRFYLQKHLLIYCDPIAENLDNHVERDCDTPEHMSVVKHSYPVILNRYRLWAVRYAHLIYRIGDDPERIFLQARRYANP